MNQIEEEIYDILFGDGGEYSKCHKLHHKLMRKMKGESKVSSHIFNLWNEMFDIKNKTSAEYLNKYRLMNKLYVIKNALQKQVDQIIFDQSIIDANISYYENIYESYNDKAKHSPCVITSKNHAVHRISKFACRTLEKETCSICLDTHGYKDIVKTSCGHIFGKSCFQNHLRSINPSDYEDAPLRTCCPMCRRCNLSLTLFAKR
jgi:hypothetical protein